MNNGSKYPSEMFPPDGMRYYSRSFINQIILPGGVLVLPIVGFDNQRWMIVLSGQPTPPNADIIIRLSSDQAFAATAGMIITRSEPNLFLTFKEYGPLVCQEWWVSSDVGGMLYVECWDAINWLDQEVKQRGTLQRPSKFVTINKHRYDYRWPKSKT